MKPTDRRRPRPRRERAERRRRLRAEQAWPSIRVATARASARRVRTPARRAGAAPATSWLPDDPRDEEWRSRTSADREDPFAARRVPANPRPRRRASAVRGAVPAGLRQRPLSPELSDRRRPASAQASAASPRDRRRRARGSPSAGTAGRRRASRSPRSTPPSSTTARSSGARGRRRSDPPAVHLTGGPSDSRWHPARAARRRRARAGATVSSYVGTTAGEALLHQRRHRDRRRRRRAVVDHYRCSARARGVPRRHAPHRRGAQRLVRLARSTLGGASSATTSRPCSTARAPTCTLNGLLPGRRRRSTVTTTRRSTTPSRTAQPRALQGHPRRQARACSTARSSSATTRRRPTRSRRTRRCCSPTTRRSTRSRSSRSSPTT